MKLFKRLFCDHYYVVKKWHITHGPLGNEPRYIEGVEECNKCGRTRLFWVEQGSAFEKYIFEFMRERQE